MKKYLYTICITIILSSCSSSIKKINNDKILLKLIPNSATTDSRSTEQGESTLNENCINNLHIFFFPTNSNDNQECVKHEVVDDISFDGVGSHEQQLKTSRIIFESDKSYDIYTVANMPEDVVIPQTITLGSVKSLHTTNQLKSHINQNEFAMDGMTTAIINPSTNNPTVMFDISLKRAISKIRVKVVVDPKSEVATASIAQFSLKNFANKGSMIDGNPYHLNSTDYSNSPYVSSDIFDSVVFYCYENSWSENSNNDTHITINLPHDSKTSNYYNIDINKISNNLDSGRIERNMIYDITVYIDKDGSSKEDGVVDLKGSCKIIDWSTNLIVLETTNKHYLNLYEDNIVMPNIDEFVLRYATDLPISITDISASAIELNSDGDSSIKNYKSKNDEFPQFTIDRDNSIIYINSKIPINYVPKNIEFTVTNNYGLSCKAKITQYPAIYVTAKESSGNVVPVYYDSGTNHNLMTINVLVPSNDGSYILGCPTNGFEKTDSTDIGNNLVSPQFIIASQYGVCVPQNYEDAQERCFLYGEDIYRSGWRMPTKAELRIIDAIQDDTNSAVKGLLEGTAYWSAYKYQYYNFEDNSWVDSNNKGKAFVRAVFDLYKGNF